MEQQIEENYEYQNNCNKDNCSFVPWMVFYSGESDFYLEKRKVLKI